MFAWVLTCLLGWWDTWLYTWPYRLHPVTYQQASISEDNPL